MSNSLDKEDFRNLLISWPDKAIKFLYEFYYDSLISISEKQTHDLKASEDIVQETFTEFWQNHERLGRSKSIKLEPYLVAMVKNKSFAFFNKTIKLNENQITFLKAELLDDNSNREKEIISLEEKEAIYRIILMFPQRERECLILKFYHDMSNEAIAEHLQITIKAVERNITSAYKRFRKYRFALHK